MTPSSQKWLFTFIALSVLIHLIGYGVKYFLSYDEVKYWFWILNSAAHTLYCVSIYYSVMILFRKNKTSVLKILLLFLEDWITLGVLDVYNQFRGHYNINPTPQWIVFGVILIIQAIRYNQWQSKQHNSRL